MSVSKDHFPKHAVSRDHFPDLSQTRTYTQRDVNVEHSRRILELEKQVAELRAATKEAGYIANYVAKFETLLKQKGPDHEV